jgi:hypothetical protein
MKNEGWKVASFRQLISITFLLIAFPSPLFLSTRAQGPYTVDMYIVNPLTGDSIFNVTDYPIGSIFTVEFYVGNVTGMITWQLHLTYNRTLINYEQTWFPDDNVFKEAIDSGAIPVKEISVNIDNATDTADLFILMTCTYPPDTSIKYPVDVTSRGLLCKTNFTISKHPTSEKLALISQQVNYSSLHVTPHYYLDGFRTCVDTLNGIYATDAEPAVFYDMIAVPEASPSLLLILIPSSLTTILMRLRRKRYSHKN